MPPPQKKQRTAAEEGEPQPALIPSSSSPEREENQESAPTKDDIKTMLRTLRDSTTASDAEDAMKDLYDAINEEKKSVTKAIVEQHGVGIILVALAKWYKDSENVARVAIRSLVTITCYQSSTTEHIATVGISQILTTANQNRDNLNIRQHTVSVLVNLVLACTEETISSEVATDECIDMVMKTMKKWPEDPQIQRTGAKYFLIISKIETIRERANQARVLPVLANAVEVFRTGTKEHYRLACDAAKMYM